MTGNVHGDTRSTVLGAEPGEQHAHELADKIRLLATTDPELAQDLVDQLIDALDRATDGAFRDHLCAGGASANGPATAADQDGWVHSSPGNS